MIGLVVVSHSSLADGLKNAAEMIVGPQPQLRAVGMAPAADLDQLRAALEAAVREVGGPSGALVLAVGSWSREPPRGPLAPELVRV